MNTDEIQHEAAQWYSIGYVITMKWDVKLSQGGGEPIDNENDPPHPPHEYRWYKSGDIQWS